MFVKARAVSGLFNKVLTPQNKGFIYPAVSEPASIVAHRYTLGARGAT